MFNLFKKKDNGDSWVASVKTLKAHREKEYRTLTQDEIKTEIMREEKSRKGEGTRHVRFNSCRITKEDFKTLKKLGYYVSVGTRSVSYDNDEVPCVDIEW